MDYFFAQISPAEAGDIDVLTEIPKQRLIEVHRQMEFFNADILIFSMNRGVLLLVNINGRKADTASERPVNRLASVPAGRIKGTAAA